MQLLPDDPQRVAGEGEAPGDYSRRAYNGSLIEDCDAANELDKAGLSLGIKASWVNPAYLAELKAKQEESMFGLMDSILFNADQIRALQ